MEAAEAVLRFLNSVGPSSEAEFYLRLFRDRPRESFAALAVDSASMDNNADGVAVDLRFLHALELTPLVVLGLDDHGSAEAHRARLQALLGTAGLATEAATLTAQPDQVARAAAAGRIPILVAADAEHQQVLENLAGLLRALGTHKLIFLRQRGGLRPEGTRLSVVNLSTDYDALLAHRGLDESERRLLQDVRRVLFDLVEHRMMVSLTSPLNLLHELFTVRGAGTLLRKGARITRCEGYQGIERARLAELLESSFGKAPRPEFYDRPLAHGYVEENYRGAALISACPLGGYLTKFAVNREAQGEGIGQDLWNALAVDYPALLWRARPSNPIRAWYERICHGRFDADGWTVYVRGIAPRRLPEAIAFALAQPADF